MVSKKKKKKQAHRNRNQDGSARGRELGLGELSEGAESYKLLILR